MFCVKTFLGERMLWWKTASAGSVTCLLLTTKIFQEKKPC